MKHWRLAYHRCCRFLNAPPRTVRNALTALQAKHEEEDSSIMDYLQAFDRTKQTQRFKIPTQQADPLRKLIAEKRVILADGTALDPREEPEIHYGTIAAGNVLLKDRSVRDELTSWLEANHVEPICFEMEAAGLMNSFPCLIIRGICDYGDENKNDAWQRYAAATAAAFGKEFLEKLSPQEVEHALPIGEVMAAVGKS